MKILIIEDDSFKLKDIVSSLNRILSCSFEIVTCAARNPGLRTFRDSKLSGDLFDLVITDNYMPIYEVSNELHPFADSIVREVHRLSKNVPVIVCSSEPIDDIEYDSFILYSHNVLLDDSLKEALEEVNFGGFLC